MVADKDDEEDHFYRPLPPRQTESLKRDQREDEREAEETDWEEEEEKVEKKGKVVEEKKLKSILKTKKDGQPVVSGLSLRFP